MNSLTHCGHGKAYSEPCNDCEIISCQQTIAYFKPKVEAAEKRLRELTAAPTAQGSVKDAPEEMCPHCDDPLPQGREACDECEKYFAAPQEAPKTVDQTGANQPESRANPSNGLLTEAPQQEPVPCQFCRGDLKTAGHKSHCPLFAAPISTISAKETTNE